MAVGLVKSMGVPATGAISPVGMRPMSVGRYDGALRVRRWSLMEVVGSPERFQ
jgi:hypothetical protein